MSDSTSERFKQTVYIAFGVRCGESNPKPGGTLWDRRRTNRGAKTPNSFQMPADGQGRGRITNDQGLYR